MNEEVKKQWIENRRARKKDLSGTDLFQRLKVGDKVALSQGITLLESSRETDRTIAKELISLALPLSGNSIRVGVTGVPGVGKSTFIESFGKHLLVQGKKLAVLAVDPTSEENGGSILGDKTRMEELSTREEVFIRPSPSGNNLGGVARATRETILLCEAAGYDFILVETVGVGQSETLVHSMVDFFLLLMLAGAGDELQGIKRGIMEMADMLLINKADSGNERQAKTALREYKNALHLFPPKRSNWIARTEVVSGLEGTNIEKVYSAIDEFERQMKLSGYFNHKRTEQDVRWFSEAIRDGLLAHFLNHNDAQVDLEEAQNAISNGKKSPFDASEEWLNKWLKNGI